MPGIRGSNRVPGGDARTRRNWNSVATAYDSRSLGDGLGLNTTRLLTAVLASSGGLTFTAEEISVLLDPNASNILTLSAAGLLGTESARESHITLLAVAPEFTF